MELNKKEFLDLYEYFKENEQKEFEEWMNEMEKHAKNPENPFKHVSVKSSNVESIAHHDNTLQVTFKNGKTYNYHGVSKDIHEELMKAESVGKFLNQHIYKHFSYSMPLQQKESDKNGKG